MKVARLRLKFVQSFGGYHYFRRRGQTRVRLPGIPGSSEFMDAYQQALSTAPIAIGQAKRSAPGSVSLAIAEYFGSAAFRALTGETPRKRRAILEKFREQYGDKRLTSLPPEFIVALIDNMTPHNANVWLTTFRHFARWAKTRKLIKVDPTFDIKVKLPKSDGFHTWTDAEVAQFEAHHPVGSQARLALAIGRYIGLRREDAVCIGRQHFRDTVDGPVVTVRPKKTETTTRVTLALPVHPELQAVLAATPTNHLTLLVTKKGRGYNGDNFTKRFGVWCDEAGLPSRCVFHGLRKLALTWLAEAGCTPHELMAFGGHASLKMVEHYTRKVNQAHLAREAMAKAAAREQSRTQGVKSQPEAVSKPLDALVKIVG
jgi:integrase